MNANTISSAGYTGPTFRGVDYSPTWPDWSAGLGAQTGDSDFANDAFQSLWSNAYQAAPSGDQSVPVSNSLYRNDLKTIRSIGLNLIRLYNWDMSRGASSASGPALDHINFLNYAASLGLQVVVPISDYFLGDTQYAWNEQACSGTSFDVAPAAIQSDFNLFIGSITDPASGKIHAAVHSISIGNEGDIGQGISSPPTTASNFLARTIWWIVNLHQQINGSSNAGPNGNAPVNGASPIIPLSATVSNADQGGNSGSWFQCFIDGVTEGQNTPNGCALGSSFASTVTGLSSADPSYASYYYNSVNVDQTSIVSPFANTLAQTVAQYDAGDSSWPGKKFHVPLLLMEVFTSNRDQFPAPDNQATAALGQAAALETYLKANKAGTASSTTFLMGYNYFEFNDEPALPKTTGLYQYSATVSTSVDTGTTQLPYTTFPNLSYPATGLVATPGPGGTGTLAGALSALIGTS